MPLAPKIKLFYFFDTESEEDIENRVNEWAAHHGVHILQATITCEGAPDFNLYVLVVYQKVAPLRAT